MAPELEAGERGPLLGLATTEELLTEVAVRMEVTQNSNKGRDLGRLCREAIANLDPYILGYSTVDGYGTNYKTDEFGGTKEAEHGS